VIFDAMSHAFFTLSVGIGSMAIFGSYLNKEHAIGTEAKNVVFLDTFIALMAGFIIIPACFAYGVEPDAGPSLLFITLPNVFNHMSGGRIWGTCFFIFMSFAALSTIIAVFENIISFYMDMGGWSRKKAVALNIVLIPLLSLPAVFGYNLLSNIQPLGAGSTIMDLEDFLVSYNLLTLGSMILVLFCVSKA
jgi:NSS family neurotransmitter:Na+ symporter